MGIPVPGHIETRLVVLMMAAAVFVTAVASVVTTSLYVSSEKDPVIAALEDEVRRKDSTITTLENQGRRSVENDVSLLLDMMDKLAKASNDKALATAIAAFSTMSEIFTALSTIGDLDEHNNRLCLNTTAQMAFQVNDTILLHYNEACLGYDSVIRTDPARFDEFTAAINTIILALIKLDNAITGDP